MTQKDRVFVVDSVTDGIIRIESPKGNMFETPVWALKKYSLQEGDAFEIQDGVLTLVDNSKQHEDITSLFNSLKKKKK